MTDPRCSICTGPLVDGDDRHEGSHAHEGLCCAALRDERDALRAERDEARTNCNFNREQYKLAFQRVQALEARLAEVERERDALRAERDEAHTLYDSAIREWEEDRQRAFRSSQPEMAEYLLTCESEWHKTADKLNRACEERDKATARAEAAESRLAEVEALAEEWAAMAKDRLSHPEWSACRAQCASVLRRLLARSPAPAPLCRHELPPLVSSNGPVLCAKCGVPLTGVADADGSWPAAPAAAPRESACTHSDPPRDMTQYTDEVRRNAVMVCSRCGMEWMDDGQGWRKP